MRLKKLGDTELQVSTVALGTWPMGGTTYGYVDDNESIATIHAALDAGINLIDTAPGYGNGRAEEVIGKAIKQRRDEVVIATKVGIVESPRNHHRDLSPASIRREIDDSLRRLDVETIDLYQIHWPDRTTPIEDSLAELAKQQQAGKFRYLGVSNFDLKLLKEATSIMKISSLQPHYSLLNREIEAEILPFCQANKISILAYGSLGSGILAGKYQEQPKFDPDDTRYNFYRFFHEPMWSKAKQLLDVLENIANRHQRPVSHVAINWITQKESVASALVGARKPAQIKENAAAGEWLLTAADLEEIETNYQSIFSA